jgi:hypothetical protein
MTALGQQPATVSYTKSLTQYQMKESDLDIAQWLRV